MRLVVLFCLFPLLAAANGIDQAHSRYMREGQFQHLREFFTGEEHTGRRLVLRTQPTERAGRYFVVFLERRLETFPVGTVALLEVLSDDDLEPAIHAFPIDVHTKPRSRQLFLGLTGTDWPSEEQEALAWRVRLLDGENVLGEWKSFLWEMP